MLTMLVPSPKNCKESLSDKSNYQPIPLTSVVSKLLEILLLQKCQDKLHTSDNQFRFKKGQLMDMCSFVLKEVIDFYVYRSNPIYLCFMDASKAFDYLNHWHLFDELLKRNIHKYIVRLLRWVNECKYLGVFMNDDTSDDRYILWQTRGI